MVVAVLAKEAVMVFKVVTVEEDVVTVGVFHVNLGLLSIFSNSHKT